MIRINLLPKKVSKRKVGLLQHLILTVAGLALLLVVMGYFWVSLNGKIADLRRQVAAAQAEKDSLKDVHAQKTAYEQNIAKLKNKLDIITNVKERRFLPVRLFDQLTAVLDRDMPVWLSSYSFQEDKVQIEGFSLSNPDLARFVTSLEKTPFYRDVDLLFSGKVKEGEREIFRFGLTAVRETEGPVAAQAGGQ